MDQGIDLYNIYIYIYQPLVPWEAITILISLLLVSLNSTQTSFHSQDPAISSSQPAGSYPPFDDGKKLDTFVKNADGGILIGKVCIVSLAINPLSLLF